MSDFISNGWSWYVIAIVVGGLVYCVGVLMGASRHKVLRDAKGNIQPTTGHVWDGDLQEYNNPLPRWWLVLYILTVVFAALYLYLYPGLGSNEGSLKWSSAGQYDKELERAAASQAEIYGAFEGVAVPDLARDPKALAIGERLFLNNCAACHGSDARGGKGFPNLADNDWLHGGEPDKIIESITFGRTGMMPPQDVGDATSARQVAQYVLSLSGSGHNSIMAELGRDKYKQTCAACHGADGQGNQALGAPNLTDKVWLHGWGEEAILSMINHGKTNVMPAQENRLTADQIKVLSAYVWGLSNSVKVAEGQ